MIHRFFKIKVQVVSAVRAQSDFVRPYIILILCFNSKLMNILGTDCQRDKDSVLTRVELVACLLSLISYSNL